MILIPHQRLYASFTQSRASEAAGHLGGGESACTVQALWQSPSPRFPDSICRTPIQVIPRQFGGPDQARSPDRRRSPTMGGPVWIRFRSSGGTLGIRKDEVSATRPDRGLRIGMLKLFSGWGWDGKENGSGEGHRHHLFLSQERPTPPSTSRTSTAMATWSRGRHRTLPGATESHPTRASTTPSS